jgi:transcriptional regulator
MSTHTGSAAAEVHERTLLAVGPVRNVYADFGQMHAAARQVSPEMSDEQLRVGQSALYPALHKLEQQGWIEAEWALSENNRRAKYYKLTAAGRRALKSETAQWERLSTAISLVVKPT